MWFALWLQPPGRTLAVFLCLMLVLGGALGWFGWQLLKQDRALEGQHLQERLELAADNMAAALRHNLAELEGYLSFVPGPGAKVPPDEVAVLLVAEHTVNAYPPGRLLYYPVIPDSEEPPASTFVAGETMEYQRSDPARAAAVFRELARSSDPGVRAGALLRLGRTLRKTGRNEEALQVFGELAQLGHTCVLGFPAAPYWKQLESAKNCGRMRHSCIWPFGAAAGDCFGPPGNFMRRRRSAGRGPVP